MFLEVLCVAMSCFLNDKMFFVCLFVGDDDADEKLCGSSLLMYYNSSDFQ